MSYAGSVYKLNYNKIAPTISIINSSEISSLKPFRSKRCEILWFQCELVERFKPLFISMTLVGLEFVDIRVKPLNTKRWTLLWNYLILMLVSASLFHNICVQIFLFNQGEANSAFYTLFSITKLIGSLMILAIFYVKKMVFATIFDEIRSHFQSSSKVGFYSHKKLKMLQKRIFFDCIICWLFLVMFIFTNIASNFGDDLKKYLHDYYFGMRLDSSNELIPLLLLSAETSIYFLATSAPTQFFALYYVLICRLTTILFQIFNETLKIHSQKSHSFDVNFVKTIRTNHNSLTLMVKKIDDKLSLVTFLQYMILMSDLSKYVYYLIDRLARRWDDHYEIVFVVVRVTQMIWLFVYISFSASRVSEESVSSTSQLQEISTQLEINQQTNCSQLQIIALLMKVYTSPSQLTGWNMFVINRGFVLTVFGVVITYSLVLFQITPWVQTKTNSTSS